MPTPTIIRNGDHAVRANFGSAGQGLQIDTIWRNGNSKQTFRAQYTGQTIRVKWEIQIRDDRVVVNLDDYDGNISDVTVEEQDYDLRTIIFEPDGVSDALVVDPYLEIDIESVSIDITCDGYILQILTDDTDYLLRLRNLADTEIGYSRFHMRHDDGGGGDNYYLMHDDDRITSIIEDTPTRKVISIKGTMNDSGGTPISNLAVEVTFYVYADRFIQDANFIVTTSAVSIASYTSAYGYLRFAGLTNPDAYAGTLPSTETDTADTTLSNDADYTVTIADELNYQTIPLVVDAGTGNWVQRNRYQTYAFFWNDGDLAVGEHRATLMCIVDSAEREPWAGYNRMQRFDGDDFAHNVLTYWECDSTTLDLFDATDGSTVTNSGGSLTATGVIGDALDVSGTDQVSFPCTDTNNITISSGAISFWFKSNSTSPTDLDSFFQWGTDGPGNANCFALTAGSSNTQLKAHVGATSPHTIIVPDIFDQEWHHLFFVWRWGTDESQSVFIDGNEAESITLTNSQVSGATVMYVGCDKSVQPDYC